MGAMRHFEANQAFDGDLKTGWTPVGPGPGEWIEVFFKAPASITSISIFSGYSNAARFSMFNRVREIRMSFPNGFSRVLTLADKMEMQRFNLPYHPVLHSIKFEIVSVYQGDKNDATPITEIEFNRPE